MVMPVKVIEGQQQTANALTLIENINISTIQSTMDKIAQFQGVVKKTLKEGHDYGVIPGTHKPTMLKPGAEKILMLMGLTSEYEILDKVQDYDGGFFAFTVRCKLSRNGMLITEGVGHANTREKRYVSHKEGKEPPDPYTLANTVLKMSKKRALVDAALTVASLSDVFTQDVEDMEIEYEQPQQHRPQRQSSASTGNVSEAQIRYIHKLKNDKKISDEDFKRIVAELAEGKTSTKDLTKKEASEIINFLNNYPVQQEQHEQQTIEIDDSDLPF
ncbi:hypothetical protein DNHGIG_14790 [Collibacillus ludicampi]|uniref:Uncharacterized protein n=1 Tax=Collibacillus ludicampi TaxID=2771369 RepID=A0AAV4LDU1_9BACL|nr:hypothetical protein [Collibacillus ludicampi]GIM45930.1 hypothetical protein DNHGIG_14790 [Collibacillus ludicampi]